MKIPRIALGSILVIMTIVSSNLNWSRANWQYILESDAKGYYAYLPAVFIYHDLNFGFFEEIEKVKYHHEGLFYDYRSSANGQIINKYYCGTALAQLPFFLLAHGITWLSDKPPDGYSYWYPVMTNMAALFYLLAGLLCIHKVLKHLKVNPLSQAVAMVAMAFGTNLFYYAVGEPGMSHIFSFGWISFFLLQTLRFFHSKHKSTILLLALSLGMITLIRPINVLVILLLPFAAGDRKSLKKGISKLISDWQKTILGLLLFASILSVQLIIYRISTGSWFVYSYVEEGFNFLDPKFLEILFSYRKGLFVYTPLYLLALIGFIPLYRANRYRAIALLGFLVVLTYILSSWWMWYYGGSFSSRVYVEFIPLFTITLAMALQWAQKNKRSLAIVSAIFILVVVCQIQTYQYRYYEIHWSEMTKEKYWDVFLRIDKLIK